MASRVVGASQFANISLTSEPTDWFCEAIPGAANVGEQVARVAEALPDALHKSVNLIGVVTQAPPDCLSDLVV